MTANVFKIWKKFYFMYTEGTKTRVIPKGVISVNAYPWHRTNTGAFRAFSYDLDGSHLDIQTEGSWVTFGFEHQISKRLEEAIKRNIDTTDPTKVYAPCVVGRCTDPKAGCYDAFLLAPPEINEDSDLFSHGLVVTGLRIENSNFKRFVLMSEHTGLQPFHAFRIKSLQRWKANRYREYHGEIKTDWHIKGEPPSLRIIGSYDEGSDVFEQNVQMLEELRKQIQQGTKFWWNMELPPEEHHAGRPDPSRFY